MELGNVTKYIENRLSLERHKVNLFNIYNRNNFKELDKSVIFINRVLHNKRFSKIKVKEEENYYINKQNDILTKKIHDINSRANVSF